MGKTRRDSEPNYTRIRSAESLWEAWSAVRESGQQSKSPATRSAIAAFKARERQHIARVVCHLRNHTYRFGKAKGIVQQRSGKKPRPIVVAPIDARIVQRSILDELQRVEAIRKVIANPNSFGGVESRSRMDAILAATSEIDADSRFFLRSDIQGFFTRIPREEVLYAITPHIDSAAGALLAEAVAVDLDNAEHLDKFRDLFPDEERGVAQGFCLSSLMGNVLLRDFDESMNGRGIRCLRYVDDFLILGPTERHVRKAFESAQRKLRALGMEAYDPRSAPEKAELGATDKAFDFLGCSIQRGLVQPSAKSRKRILARIDEILDGAAFTCSDPRVAYRTRHTLSRTLYDVGNVLRGWRDSFSFCEHGFVFTDFDGEIDTRIARFLRTFRSHYRAADRSGRRMLLGVPVLAESVRRSEVATA